MEKHKNFLFGLFGIVCIIIIFSCYYVYAEKDTTYEVDDIQIQCLFESEQVILETYNMSVEVEEIVNTDVTSMDLETEDAVNLVEENTILSLSNIKISTFEEEYYTNNRLASRNVNSKIGNAEESHYDKLYRLFGSKAKYMDGRVNYYLNETEALRYMTSFQVVVWDLDDNGEWYQREQWLTSHYTLEATLKCIFNELLELPEEDRVPIKSMGCYHYREGSSAHTCGAAIDINWEENAEMTIDGVITCGRFWKPYENIYSIKADSPFVHIFEKYGWTWGGYWTSKKDYMHFSYIDR